MAGNVTAIRENGAASGLGVLITYSYDNLGRRTGVTRGNGTTTSYAFDAVSRLSSTTQNLSGTAHDQTIGSITYNPARQIQSQVKSNDVYAWTGHYNVGRNYTVNGLNQQTAAGATALGYDARGNLTTSGSSTYGYNRLNQLTSAPGVTLYYDTSGRLVEYNTATSTRFYYAGSSMLAEVSNPSGAILRRYVPGPGTDEPVVWYEGSTTADRRWLHADERGSVIAVSNGSGAMLAINRYDEYGIPQSSNAGRFQYTGQAWLPELGMYYYKARMYSPTLGRFMQTDPIGYGDGMNWYNYVGSDPVNGTDPSGTEQGNGQVTIGSEILVTGLRPKINLGGFGTNLGSFSGVPGGGALGGGLNLGAALIGFSGQAGAAQASTANAFPDRTKAIRAKMEEALKAARNSKTQDEFNKHMDAYMQLLDTPEMRLNKAQSQARFEKYMKNFVFGVLFAGGGAVAGTPYAGAVGIAWLKDYIESNTWSWVWSK